MLAHLHQTPVARFHHYNAESSSSSPPAAFRSKSSMCRRTGPKVSAEERFVQNRRSFVVDENIPIKKSEPRLEIKKEESQPLHPYDEACAYQKRMAEDYQAQKENGLEQKLGAIRIKDDEDASRMEKLTEILSKVDGFGCHDACTCKDPEDSSDDSRRKTAPLKKVIGHRFHYTWREVVDKTTGNTELQSTEELFLLCLRDTELSYPDFIRVCLVPHHLRLTYLKDVEGNGGLYPSRMKDWTETDERSLKRAMHEEHKFSEKHARQQWEIAKCVNTTEWVDLTDNGAKPLPPMVKENVKNPPPVVLTKDGGQYWEVERVLGATMGGNGEKPHYLIKWKGWDHVHNSWEPSTGVKSKPMITAFFQQYGKPTKSKPRVLSPEGREFVAWVEDYEKGVNRPLKRLRTH